MDDEHARRLLAAHCELLKERLTTALRAIEWNRAEEARKDEKARVAAGDDAYLLRVYLALMASIADMQDLVSRQQGREEFMVFVRAAAAARELEKIAGEARHAGGGFAAGVAEAMEHLRKQAEKSSGDTDGGMFGSSIGRQLTPAQRLDEYEEHAAAHRAAVNKAKVAKRSRLVDDDSGPSLG